MANPAGEEMGELEAVVAIQHATEPEASVSN
jgi:hypothetical protein